MIIIGEEEGGEGHVYVKMTYIQAGGRDKNKKKGVQVLRCNNKNRQMKEQRRNDEPTLVPNANTSAYSDNGLHATTDPRSLSSAIFVILEWFC